jgi:hypothetical protein
MFAVGWPGSRPRCPAGCSAARLVIGFVVEAGHHHHAGPHWLAAQAQAPGRPLLQYLVAVASSRDHAGRDGFRLCLVDRLVSLPGHPLTP